MIGKINRRKYLSTKCIKWIKKGLTGTKISTIYFCQKYTIYNWVTDHEFIGDTKSQTIDRKVNKYYRY